MSQIRRRARLVRSAVAAIAFVALAACSDAGDDATGAAPAAPVVRDLASYDAFVIASAENNPLFADVYGLRFNPVVAERITTMKRVSTMGANVNTVLVAAADGDADRLAMVNGDGSLGPIPGLGRPYASLSAVDRGTLYYDIVDPDSDRTRSFAFDLEARKRAALLESDQLSAPYPLGNGRFLYSRAVGLGEDNEVVLRETSGKTKTLSIGATEVYGGVVGKAWVAGTINESGSSFGNKPKTLVLLNIESGKTMRIDGLQDVCWTPDGTKLLARRVEDPLSSPLVLLDPNHPRDLIEVGTVPGLAVYSGTWVRNSPSA